jgi:Protein of unknown function (DUF4238)
VQAKRHHTVSYFLVSDFARDTPKGARVCQLEVASGGNRQISPKDAAVYKHFYTLVIEESKRSDVIERALATIEAASAPLVRKLAAPGTELTATERLDLSMFVAVTKTRTPRARASMASGIEQLMEFLTLENARVPEAYLELARKAGADIDPEQVELERLELVQGLETGTMGIEMPANALIGMALNSAYQLAWIIYLLDWVVVRAADGAEFVIADAPVAAYDPTPEGPSGAAAFLSSPNAETTLPLGPRHALVLRASEEARAFASELHDQPSNLDPEAGVRALDGRPVTWAEVVGDKQSVAEINLRSYANAGRYIFGSQQGVTGVRARARQRPAEVASRRAAPGQLHILEADESDPDVMRLTQSFTAEGGSKVRRGGR